MGSIEVQLPQETLTHIFSYLSDYRRDIAACRLVCRCFLACCSEFLIPRVTFAKRLDTLQRLWEVLEHPYFRRHVKELVYDASVYEESLVTDFEEYEDACDRLCSRSFHDDEAMKETQMYAEFYSRVCRTRPWRGVWERHTTGMHRGFLDYFRRWRAQNQIIDDGLDSEILIAGLERLPKLRRIVFTDFRELAREGEGYSAICERIFGNTLEPRGLSFSNDIFGEFMLLMDFIADRPQTDIRSLSIGGHPYESLVESWATVQGGPRHLHRPFDPPAMPDDPDRADVDNQSAQGVCANLRHLRLPISFKPKSLPHIIRRIDARIRDTYVGQILEFSAPNLVRLSLCSLDLLFHHGSGGIGIWPAGRRCLEFLLLPLSFSSLRQLELRGWPLPEGASFEEFLSKHSSTLEELRLVECVVSEDPRRLGRWAGENMSLNGVEIKVTAEYEAGKDRSNRLIWNDADLEALWLAGRPNSFLGQPHFIGFCGVNWGCGRIRRAGEPLDDLWE